MRTVYLAGPIFNCQDKIALEWRQYARERLITKFHVIDPMDRDLRGFEDESAAIVEGDVRAIMASDVLLARVDIPGWGTAMELRIAHQAKKQIVGFGLMESAASPWIRYHVSELHLRLVDAVDSLALLEIPA